MRWVYVGAGLLALSASCYMAVMASGGIHSASAPALIAMAVILGVGAAAIGTALAGGHVGIAVVIGLGMLAGECGAMLQTAQRITAAREAMRAPMADLALKRKATLKDLADAEAAKSKPLDHSRLDAAEIAKAEAEKAVREKSAERGCRQNCRLLLQSAVDAAQHEVEASREDLTRQDGDQTAAKAKQIEIAKAAVAALPPPQSATPLADNTGVPEWVLDVIEALTLSFSINLPASALIALGVKMGKTQSKGDEPKEVANATALEEVPSKAESDPRPLLLSQRPHRCRNPDDDAERFGIAMLRPDKDSRLPTKDIPAVYFDWCNETERDPLPLSEIAPALGRLFRRAGIDIVDGSAIGVTVKP